MDLDTSTFPPRAKGPMWKGATAQQEREQRQRTVRTSETKSKAKVRERDGAAVCRLFGPACEYLREGRFECAHIDGKGMGGDKGKRSTPDCMVRSCHQHHQGARSLHSKHVRVEFLTAKKANGPILVWQRDKVGSSKWTLVREETRQ